MVVSTIVPHSGSPNPPYDIPSVCRRHLDHKCSMKGSLGRTFQTSAALLMPISQRSRTKQNIGPLQNADRRPDDAPRRGRASWHVREQREHRTGRKYIGGVYIRRWSFHSTHLTGYSQSVSQSVSMKTFSLSEDRVVVVKSRNGSQYLSLIHI